MKAGNESERQWLDRSVSSVRLLVIVVAADRVVAGIVLYLAPGLPWARYSETVHRTGALGSRWARLHPGVYGDAPYRLTLTV